MTEDEVINASNLLKPIHFDDSPSEEEEDQTEMLNVGTTLFELYLGLQRFAMYVFIFLLVSVCWT